MQPQEIQVLEAELDIPLSKFHESWRNNWGMSIGSKEIREKIEKTERLSSRIREEILLTTKPIIKNMQCDNVNFSQELKDLSKLFVEYSSLNLKYKVGLALNANTIKAALNTDHPINILKELDKKDIRYALTFCEISPLTEGNTDIESSQLNERIILDGENCLTIWLESFPKEIAAALLVLLPKFDSLSKKEGAEDLPKEKIKGLVDQVLKSISQQ